MAVSVRLKQYLALERLLIDLDGADAPEADELRDRMDPIWLGLSPEERGALDTRFGDPEIFAGAVRWIASSTAIVSRRDLAVRQRVRERFARAA